MTDGPRLIGRKKAAAHCDIAESTFSMWVATGKMPPAIPGTRKWDKRAIDAKLDEVSGLTPEKNEDPYKKWERGYREKQAARAPFKPRLTLRPQQQRVLAFMADNPDCSTLDSIPGAGERTMEILIEAGAVLETAGLYALTRTGQKEAARLAVWLAR